MATKLARRAATPARRSNAGIYAKLAKEKASSAARVATAKAGSVAKARAGTIITAGTAAALGAAESRNMQLPTVGGIAPSLLYGVIGVLVVPMFMKGKIAQISEQFGAGALAVAAYKLGMGQPVIGT